LGTILTDLAFVYKQSMTEIIKIPRKFRRLMMEHIPRLLAQQQILDSAVVMYPMLTEEARTTQMDIWQKVAQIVGFVGGFLNQVLWEGTVGEDIPKGMVVAEDWDAVEAFFTTSTGLLA
jgi:hypothetical protein